MTKEFVTSLYNHERCETHVDTKTQIEKKRKDAAVYQKFRRPTARPRITTIKRDKIDKKVLN